MRLNVSGERRYCVDCKLKLIKGRGWVVVMDEIGARVGGG